MYMLSQSAEVPVVEWMRFSFFFVMTLENFESMPENLNSRSSDMRLIKSTTHHSDLRNLNQQRSKAHRPAEIAVEFTADRADLRI